MGNKNKIKGTRLENRIVVMAQNYGLSARKQPLSGQLSMYPEDCVVENVLIQSKAGYTRQSKEGQRYFSFDFDWLKRVCQSAESKNFEMGAVAFRPNGTNQIIISMQYEDFLNLLLKGKAND
jgi:hypothetical protein